MDKNNTEAHSPSAKFNCFQWTYSYCVTIVWTYSTTRIHKDQRYQRSRKRTKRPENGVTSATILRILLRLYLLFTFYEWFQL